MIAFVGLARALRTAADLARHRVERMPSALERFGFQSEDEPPSPA
ncbi:hypothetical protein [Nocardia huaxiensis]|nr:hypothetical protein [Nocardia huaxiensis]